MADASVTSPQKVSRYRSQRKAQQQAQADEIPDVPQVPEQQGETTGIEDGIARSRSRYHRKNAGADQGVRPATARAQDQIDTAHNAQEQSPPSQACQPIASHQSQRRRGNSKAARYRERHASPAAQLGAQDPRHASVDDDGYGEESHDGQVLNGHSVKHSLGASPPASEPTGELFPPPRSEPVQPAAQPVRHDGPPTSAKNQAAKSVSQLPTFSDSDTEGRGCFGLFKRKRGEATPGAPEKTPVARPPKTNGGLQDAPKSAVNAGDRSVLIECGRSKTIFPVTPTTTAVDLIKSAANCMSEPINVRSAVLLESFGSVGVQRPLRRYEPIRDVMNSWDTDRQNSLILVDPGTGSSEAELSQSGAPKSKPVEQSWWMSYSQKVGRWDKRLITLHPDGRITAQKDDSMKAQQQAENVCHMDDFDVYTPTAEKLRKRVKPPKKYCFATKSQRKTIMFESTHNFVHFFCTGDKATADDFYAAVQSWRSWYLVNVLGEGKKSKPQEQHTMNAKEKEIGAGSGAAKGHRPGDSVGSHYQLGSFKPLLDADDFEKQPTASRSARAPPPASGGFVKSANQFDPMVSPERRTSTRKKGQQQLPPVAMNKRQQLADDEPLGNLTGRASLENGRPAPGEFAESGLLGRSYSQRQRDTNERDQNLRPNAFTDGPNLLNGGYDGNREDYVRRQSVEGSPQDPRRNQSTRVRHLHKTTDSGRDVRRSKSSRNHGIGIGTGSGSGSGDLGRSGSTKMPSKPLVDLTPQYREPPQHTKKGKGHIPDQVGPGGLIDSATSPEDPLGIPPSTDWRGRNNSPGSAMQGRPGTSGGQQQQQRRRSTSRGHTSSGQQRRPTTSRSPDSGNGAFTGEGLLAGSHGQSGWGGADRGRGIGSTQVYRGEPLVDVNEPSKFTPGSLLNRVDRSQVPGPVIDREFEDDGRRGR